MARSARGPGFYLTILVTGFLLGGFLHAWLSKVIPAGTPPSAFFTASAHGEFGPVHINLLVVDLTLGLGVTISLASVLGVFVAAMIARSLF